MRNVGFFISIFTLVLFLSCTRSSSFVNNIECEGMHLKIETNKIVDSYSLSTIVDSIEYVKLSSSDNDMVGEVAKIHIDDEHIYLSDYSDNFFCFKKDGQFIYKINRVGKGSGEYSKLVDFTVDDDRNEIIISDDVNLLFFDIKNGEFIRRIKSPSPAYRMEYIGNAELVFDTGMNTDLSNEEDGNLYKILISDLDGKVTRRYFPFDKRLYGTSNIYYKTPQFFRNDLGIWFNPILENAIYILEDGDFKCEYLVDFGSKNITKEMLGFEQFHSFLTSIHKNAILGDVFAIGQKKIIYYTFENKPFISVADESLNNIISFDYRHIVNDIDGLPVSPFVASLGNNTIISILYPHQLLENLNSKRLFSTIKEFDNPIIAFYRVN